MKGKPVEKFIKHRNHKLTFEEKGWNQWSIEVVSDTEISLVAQESFYVDDATESLFCEDCGVAVELPNIV